MLLSICPQFSAASGIPERNDDEYQHMLRYERYHFPLLDFFVF
jgi:hypothetical protein